MPFRIMMVGTSDDPVFAINPASGQPFEFETGDEAQIAARQLAASGDGTKWRVKRILDTRWKTREAHKFENGTYARVPWWNDEWWRSTNAAMIHRHHYPHVSKTEPGMLSYTESEEQGMDNKRTLIKPGRYLEKYFAPILNYYGFRVKDLAHTFENLTKIRVVHFAATEDDVQWVYEHGPRSCMSDAHHRERSGYGHPRPGLWPLGFHACRVYIAGDLQVAYMTSDDKPKGPVESRALVWPEKKTHSRCYGNEPTLKHQLAMLGYKPGAPIGAKIQRHPVEAKDTTLFVVPYIDVGQQSGAGATAVKDKKTHLEIVEACPGSYLANSTSGLSNYKLDKNMRPIHHAVENCQLCEEHEDEVGELSMVRLNGSGGDHQYWCQGCIDETGTFRSGRPRGAFFCDADGVYYARGGNECVEMTAGGSWSLRAFRAHGFVCKATGGNYHIASRIRMYNGDLWYDRHFNDNGFTCWWTGDHYPNDMKIVLPDGRFINKILAEQAMFECDGCHKNWLKVDMVTGYGVCPRCAQNEHLMRGRIRGYQPPNRWAIEEYI